jgi:hypothetical protein
LEIYVDFYNINKYDDYLMRLHLSSLINKIKPFEQNLIFKSIPQLLSDESKNHYESIKLEIVELKNNKLKKLDIRKKFILADSQDIYSNVYWTLYEDSHNGLGSLHEKYINGNSEFFTFITDKFSDQNYLNPFLTLIIGTFSSTLKILAEHLSEFKLIADLGTQTIDPLLLKE